MSITISMSTSKGEYQIMEANPMQGMAMHLLPRCSANTRQATPCRSPAVQGMSISTVGPGSSRCRKWASTAVSICLLSAKCLDTPIISRR